MENLKVMSNSIIRSTRTEIKKKKIIKIIAVKVRGTTTITEVRLPIVAPVVSVVLIIHSIFFFFSAIIDKFGNNARHWLGLLNQNFVVRVIYTKYIALGNNKQWKRRKKKILSITQGQVDWKNGWLFIKSTDRFCFVVFALRRYRVLATIAMWHACAN